MKILTKPNIQEYEHLNDVKKYVKHAFKVFLICLLVIVVNNALRYIVGAPYESLPTYIFNGVSIFFTIGLLKTLNVLIVYRYPTFAINSFWFSETSAIVQYQKWVLSKYTDLEQEYMKLRKGMLCDVILIVFFSSLFFLFIFTTTDVSDYTTLAIFSGLLLFSVVMFGYDVRGLIIFNKKIKSN